jgi:pyruvate-formate lyase
MTLEKLVEILDADFQGFETERQIMLNLPKFGNDHEGVDALHTELSAFVNRTAFEAGRRAGLDFFLNCNLNPGGGYYRQTTKASADGRHCGEAMAYGNAPTAGRDREGVTALLNSMAKHDKLHLGYVHNLKLSKSLFSPQNRPKLECLLDTYFDNGGIQAMVTAMDRDDLARAQENPDQYANLLVRVAGWTSRFVELPPHDQIEIMNRTFHE